MSIMVVSAEAFTPGEYLRDELDVRGWTAQEFAEIIGRPVQAISEILNGHKQITAETALAFGEALGTTPDLWLNLQTAFNLHTAKSVGPELSNVARRARLRDKVPVAELQKRGWLPSTKDLDELEAAVMEFLGIDGLDGDPHLVVAARRSGDVAYSPQQTAWLAKVRHIAETHRLAELDIDAAGRLAKELVHKIHEPEDLVRLKGWLGDVGIALVTLDPLKSSKLDGAVMKIKADHVAIGLTARGNRMDSYIFTLLHELAHLCSGHLDHQNVLADEDIVSAEPHSGIEEEANRQAADWILPATLDFSQVQLSPALVRRAADQFHVHPSLVIGRIHHDTNDYSFMRRVIPRVRLYVDSEG